MKVFFTINAQVIHDLIQTGIDFNKEVNTVYFDDKYVWFALHYPECTIYVQGFGDGTFYLFRTPVGFNFDFESASTYNMGMTITPTGVVQKAWYDFLCNVPFKAEVDNLRKRN